MLLLLEIKNNLIFKILQEKIIFLTNVPSPFITQYIFKSSLVICASNIMMLPQTKKLIYIHIIIMK